MQSSPWWRSTIIFFLGADLCDSFMLVMKLFVEEEVQQRLAPIIEDLDIDGDDTDEDLAVLAVQPAPAQKKLVAVTPAKPALKTAKASAADSDSSLASAIIRVVNAVEKQSTVATSCLGTIIYTLF